MTLSTSGRKVPARPSWLELEGVGLLASAAACWAGLALLSVSRLGHGHRMAGMATVPAVSAAHVHPVTMFAACWALMVGAMTAPLLIPLAEHVRARSFRERRSRSVVLLCTSYFANWIVAGVASYPVTILLSPDRAGVPWGVFIALAAACAWQIQPARTKLFRRCRAGINLAPCGPRADIDCIRAGWRAAIACMVTCLPMMVVGMLGPMRLVTMALLATVMLVERRRSATLSPIETAGAYLVVAASIIL